MSLNFTSEELLYAGPLIVAAIAVCFICFSILVFAVTGKSMLWRINHWLKTPSKAPQWLINMDPGIQVNKIADKYYDRYDEFMERFRSEAEECKYPCMNDLIANNKYKLFNIDQLFNSNDYLKIKIGWANASTNKDLVVPIWHYYENGECYMANSDRMINANVYILFLAGIYEKPMFKTYRKYHKYIIYP